MVVSPANFKFRRTRLPEPLYHEPEIAISDFGVQYSANHIAIGRPQVKKTLVELSGNGVPRVGQIENPGTILEHDRMAGPARVIFQQAAERFGGHACIVPTKSVIVCDP